MNEQFESAQTLIRSKRYDEALDIIEKALSCARRLPKLLVLKGVCLQLTDDATLEEVQACFQEALDVDNDYIDAILEMGWFHHVMLNDPKAALSYFERATSLLKILNSSLLQGIVACSREISPEVTESEVLHRYTEQLLQKNQQP